MRFAKWKKPKALIPNPNSKQKGSIQSHPPSNSSQTPAELPRLENSPSRNQQDEKVEPTARTSLLRPPFPPSPQSLPPPSADRLDIRFDSLSYGSNRPLVALEPIRGASFDVLVQETKSTNFTGYCAATWLWTGPSFPIALVFYLAPGVHL